MRRYAAYLIDINDYLDDFPGAKAGDKIGERDINEIILNSMPNGCSVLTVKILLLKSC